jgi:GH15 family glucan-1,4-alpha-glucosidase
LFAVPAVPERLLERTRRYWRNWVHDCPESDYPFGGEYHDAVTRSELVLKLLMHHRTGAIAAAPTTSLPELIGGTRNLDYRFSWIRDAAFTIQALYKLGHIQETKDYFDWCLDVIHSGSGTFQPFQPLFGLQGETQLTEETLDHLEGYRGSAPVREVIEYVCTLWNKRGAGMWEVRSEIREVVLERGFNEEINSFGRSFESDELLDASALRIPLVGFLPFDDPRVQGTIDAVRERLTTEEGLVHRYEGEDGLPGDEGAFVLCSFWLVDCLALSGEVEEAEQLFENILEYTGPLGLLSEEIVPETGEPLGNYPQAFSHLGLINSAIYIEAAKNEESTVDIDYPAIDTRLE